MTYRQFLQRVRRHRPGELLPALAATAIQLFDQEAWTADRMCFPWAIAAAAKASIVGGNEHRRRGVSQKDVIEICSAYNALDTPLEQESQDISESVGAFLVRTEHEQFPYQQSYFEEISRLDALFAGIDDLSTEILTTALVKQLLGCSLHEFVVAGFIIAVGAQASAGFFDPEWPALRQGPHAIDPHFSVHTIRRVFDQHFRTTFDAVRAEAKKAEQSDERLAHHEFNPLVSRPFVTLPDQRYLAPQPHYAFQRLSSSALYYAGVARLDKADADAFTRDMGVAVQAYVGRQLRLMPGAQVLPEIVYDQSQRSVDWFVVFDALVLLVEVKSTRLSHLARMGGNKLGPDVKRCVGKAYEQIRRSDDLLTQAHPAFAHIPTDRPRLGLVATLEPYWAANSTFLRGLLPQPVLPTTVASVRALERLVDVVRALDGPEPLISVLGDADRSGWNLENALPDIAAPKNPILEQAWKRYPFPRA